MRETEPDGELGRTRRLPKRATTPVDAAAADAVSSAHVAPLPHSNAPVGRGRLYFEPLPEPQEARMPVQGEPFQEAALLGYLAEPDEPAAGSADELVAPVVEAHAAVVESSSSQPVLPYVNGDLPPVARKVERLPDEPVLQHRSEAAPRVQRIPATGVRKPSQGVSEAESGSRTGPVRGTTARDNGDPRPASARPSGVTRSRPQRPTGTSAEAQTSSETPGARFSGSMPVAPTSDSSLHATREGEHPELPAMPLGKLSRRETLDTPATQPAVEPPPLAKVTPPRTNIRESKAGAVVAMVFASAALLAYAFEIGSLQGAADAFVTRLSSGGSSAAQVIGSLTTWLLPLPALALFGYIVWLLAGIIGLRRPGKKRKRSRKTRQAKSPVQQFKLSAARHDIGGRTAYRAWKLLETVRGADSVVAVEANLTGDLHMSVKEVRALHLALLADLGKISEPLQRLPPVETVLDMLHAVEAAPAVRTERLSADVALPGDPGPRRKRGGNT